MARRVRYALAARRFILSELAYLGERSRAAALRFRAELSAAETRIGDYPEIGPAGRVATTRRLSVGPYVPTYRIGESAIEIIAVRHGQQAAPDDPARRPSPPDEKS